MFKLTALFLMAVDAVIFAAGSAYAAGKVHEGVVVSVAAGKLVMADLDGKNERGLDVSVGTRIMLDGKDAKLAELRTGDLVLVTQDMESKIVLIVATRKRNVNGEAPQSFGPLPIEVATSPSR